MEIVGERWEVGRVDGGNEKEKMGRNVENMWGDGKAWEDEDGPRQGGEVASMRD
jgi:hypothetical protein